MQTPDSIRQKIDELAGRSYLLGKSLQELFALIVVCKDLLADIFANFGDFIKAPGPYILKAKTKILEAKSYSQVYKFKVKELNEEANKVRDYIVEIRGGKRKHQDRDIKPRQPRKSMPSKGRQKLDANQEVQKLKTDLENIERHAQKTQIQLEKVQVKIEKLRLRAAKLKATKQSPVLDASASFRQDQQDGLEPALSQTVAPHCIDSDLIDVIPDDEAIALAYAPQWQRQFALKYLHLLKATQNLSKKETIAKIEKFNKENPDKKTSYPSLCRARRKYYQGGMLALFPKWTNRIEGTIHPEWMDYFKSLYLTQGSPSLNSCWVRVAGKFANNNLINFPTASTFLSQLRKEIGQNAIDYARLGFKKWNRKRGPYIERDVSALYAGQCWISDHNQLDVATAKDGKPIYAWQTSWRDWKSGKILAAYLHAEAPNSDHILQSFYLAAKKYGLPKEIYIDNGKDYRCRDFAGGRRYVKVIFEEQKAALVQALGIEVHFAIPYNAQAKVIERDFLNFKNWLSRFSPGFRGGNPVEKPEILSEQIKKKTIVDFNEFTKYFNIFIDEIYNSRPYKDGKSPNQIWAEENIEKRYIKPEALQLFCMRSSKPMRIGRNGVYDSAIKQFYWAEWMPVHQGKYVYLRRDPEDWGKAWCFSVNKSGQETQFLGVAELGILSAPALAKTQIEKQKLSAAIAAKNRAIKQVRELAKAASYDPYESLCDMARGMQALTGGSSSIAADQCKMIRLVKTDMDDVMSNQNKMEQDGRADLSILLPPEEPPKKKLYIWETDKELDEMEVKDDD